MWKKSKKRFLSLLLAVCVCAMFAVTAYAVTPYYINEITAKCELTTQTGKRSCVPPCMPLQMLQR